ncbi:hypothetical protein NEHOM01_2286 [Nematocida homosporus]|uniref:uncharacterized protein n=1 Tax=Nematocida homosporus TaxID=1912981 RepID=UPI00221F84D1|nr:uncharacterized protein NEHOM01_2286 [Nematocida homosporus]KAI5187580.1 hypothetical protein NEHOM01_2286 [Nematocida homosporus]
MNRYSLNVYQVVFLVIGLGCVWCSAGEDSDKMGLFDISKRIMLYIDSQMALVYDEITNAIDELKALRNKRAMRIDIIKLDQQDRMKQEQQLYKGLKSIQSNPSCLDKLEDVFEQMKIKAISVLVKEELIRESLDIVIQQMEQWLFECKNAPMSKESRREIIGKLAIIVKQIHQIEKSDLKGPQNQFPNPKISRIENGLIAIGARCDSHELKRRFATIMVTELMKIRPNINRLDRNYLTQVGDSTIDKFLKYDELKSLDNISRIIEEALVWLVDGPKNMEVKSESVSEQKPTGSEPSTSRTQSSNPQTNKSGMCGKLHSGSRSADQDSTSSFNGYGLKQPGLDQQGCILS